METINNAYQMLLWFSAVFLVLSICACLILAIIGPRFTDRIVSINVICTKVVIMIALLSFLLEESNLLDIAIVYAMVSFLAVVVLSKCYVLPHHTNLADPDYDPQKRFIDENAEEDAE